MLSFVMENLCDRFDRVEKHGNELDIITHDSRKVWVELKSNNSSRAKRPRLANYDAFKENVYDISEGDYEDETIGHRESFWHRRNHRDFRNITRGNSN